MVYAQKVASTDKRFSNRAIEILTPGEYTRIPVPDSEVLCNGCNRNLYPDPGYMVYLGKRELRANLPYDFFCEGCLKEFFPECETVN